MTVRCPACGEIEGKKVLYGFPGPDLTEAVERGDVMLGGCEVSLDSPGWACTACGHDFSVPSGPDGRILIGPEDVTPETYASAATLLRDRTLLFHEVAEGIRAGLDTDPCRTELREWLEQTYSDDVTWSDPLTLWDGHHDLVVPRPLAHLTADLDESMDVCVSWDAHAPLDDPPGDRWIVGRRSPRYEFDEHRRE